MNTHSDIIGLWPSAAAFGDDIGIPGYHARSMKRRNSIPAAHWSKVIDAAQDRGYGDVTLEKLAEMAARPAAEQQGQG